MPYTFLKLKHKNKDGGMYDLKKRDGKIIHTKAKTLSEAQRIGRIRESYADER